MAITKKKYNILLKPKDRPEEIIEVEGTVVPLIVGIETFVFKSPVNKMWYVSDNQSCLWGYYWIGDNIKKKVIERAMEVVNRLGAEEVKKRISEARLQIKL